MSFSIPVRIPAMQILQFVFLSFALSIIFFPRHCFSQPELFFSSFSLVSNDSAKFSAGIYGDGFLNSASVNNRFFHQFRKGGYISGEIKDDISRNLGAGNRLGADVGYGVFFSQKISENWNYSLLISDRAHLNAQFPKELFDLILYGNKKFAGDTVILDNTNFNFLRYQQIQAGIIRTSGKGNRYGLAFSFLKGEENYYAKFNRARLFTEENGESLSVDFNAEINRTDTGNKGLDAFHGWGISCDLFSEFAFKVKERNSLFRAEINDIGAIQWNKKSLVYKADTSIHFEGIYISDIFQLNDSVLKTISPDTMMEDLQSSQVLKSHVSYLPALMKLSWMLEVNKFLFSFEMAHRLNANYNPFISLKTSYKFSSSFSASSKFSYGGYGKTAFGVELNLAIKNFMLLAGSNNLEGLIFPEYSGGNSAFIALRKEF